MPRLRNAVGIAVVKQRGVHTKDRIGEQAYQCFGIRRNSVGYPLVPPSAHTFYHAVLDEFLQKLIVNARAAQRIRTQQIALLRKDFA